MKRRWRSRGGPGGPKGSDTARGGPEEGVGAGGGRQGLEAEGRGKSRGLGSVVASRGWRWGERGGRGGGGVGDRRGEPGGEEATVAAVA